MKVGQPVKIDYEYKRNGTCNIFMISEPFNDFRDVKVTERRTKKDFAELLNIGHLLSASRSNQACNRQFKHP